MVPKVLEFVGGRDRPMLKYMDATAYGFSVGWFFGRMGCFSAHDHVGKVTDLFFAVKFPNGWRAGVPDVAGFGPAGFTPRFDLGFIEMLWAGSVFLFFHFVARRWTNLRPGWYAAFMMVAYAPLRFFLDTLRATDIEGADKRYFAELLQPGLTPGQMGSVVLLFVGLFVWYIGGRRKADPKYMEWKDGVEELAETALTK